MKIPLAEHMNTVQGEGMHTGVPMHFIRLPGCSVGASATAMFLEENKGTALPILSTGVRGSKCQTYDGRVFDCDTDYHRAELVEIDELLDQTYEKAICLTGGEPLNHQNKDYFDELFNKAYKRKIRIHIETSGTVELKGEYKFFDPWITVAPKHGVKAVMLQMADEVKLLIDEHFSDTSTQIRSMLSYITGQVFVSSINFEKEIDKHNLDLCMQVLRQHPNWRLGVQLHKLIGVR